MIDVKVNTTEFTHTTTIIGSLTIRRFSMLDPVTQVPVAPPHPVQQPQSYYPVRQPDFSDIWGF
jgi:hypothetical protein